MELSGLRGRVALVTAAAGGGIGQTVAHALAAAGASVAVTDRHAGRTAEVSEAIARETGGTVVGLPLDVSDRDAIDRVVDRVAEELGPVDLLVNNAARNVHGQIWDYDPATWDELVETNLSACWYLCRRTMPAMREHGGNVINISSVAPYIGGGGVEAPYAITKGALHALTRALAVEGGPHGIRVNAVTMGVVVGTHFIDQNPSIAEKYRDEVPLGRHAVPSDIANAVLFLCSDQASFVTGEILNVAGGWYMRP